MTTYEVRSDGAAEAIQAESLEDAIKQAQAWAAEGDWEPIEKTFWVHVRLFVFDDGKEVGNHWISATIDPPEPKCNGKWEHDWQAPLALVGGIEINPGVFMHGGGVVIHKVCMRCGCSKETDTWAQDRESGKEGLESVEYHEGAHADEVSDLMREAVTFEVQHSINEGQALIVARVNDLSATYVVAAEEAEDQGYSLSDSDTWPLSGDWPDPPADLIAEARELAASWEGI